VPLAGRKQKSKIQRNNCLGSEKDHRLKIKFDDLVFVREEAAKYGIPLRSVLIKYYNLAHRTGLTTDKVSEFLSLLTTLVDKNVTSKTVNRVILYYKLWPGDRDFLGIILKRWSKMQKSRLIQKVNMMGIAMHENNI
jgi:hypothetical protein